MNSTHYNFYWKLSYILLLSFNTQHILFICPTFWHELLTWYGNKIPRVIIWLHYFTTQESGREKKYLFLLDFTILFACLSIFSTLKKCLHSLLEHFIRSTLDKIIFWTETELSSSTCLYFNNSFKIVLKRRLRWLP